MFGYLLELGPMRDGGMGNIAVTWQELKAWSDVTKASLDAWQAKTLKRLSDEYVYQFNVSIDPNCPAPYQNFTASEIPQETHETVDQKLRSIFAKMKAKV